MGPTVNSRPWGTSQISRPYYNVLQTQHDTVIFQILVLVNHPRIDVAERLHHLQLGFSAEMTLNFFFC